MYAAAAAIPIHYRSTHTTQNNAMTGAIYTRSQTNQLYTLLYTINNIQNLFESTSMVTHNNCI